MEALIASYGDPSSSDSDSDLTYPASTTPIQKSSHHTLNPLPPPPLDLLNPPTSHGTLYSSQTGQPSRLRNFPHVEGNYALHVFIPGYIFFSTCVR